MARREPDILRITTPTSIDSIGVCSFMEERGKTFVVSQSSDDIGGASEIELLIENDMDHILRIVNEKFEARESHIKDELRSEFEDRLQQIEKSHEDSLKHLKKELSNLSKVSLECEYLKTLQNELRTELNLQHEKIRKLTKENHRLKNDTKSRSVTEGTERLKEENEKLKEENNKREHEISKLSMFISQKELEINSLKTQIDIQYRKIQLDLTNTRDKFRTEHKNLNVGMKKQELVLCEISEAVKHITKPTDDKTRTTKPHKAPAVGSTNKHNVTNKHDATSKHDATNKHDVTNKHDATSKHNATSKHDVTNKHDPTNKHDATNKDDVTNKHDATSKHNATNKHDASVKSVKDTTERDRNQKKPTQKKKQNAPDKLR